MKRRISTAMPGTAAQICGDFRVEFAPFNMPRCRASEIGSLDAPYGAPAGSVRAYGEFDNDEQGSGFAAASVCYHDI